MRVRSITSCALGLAAALSIVASPLAAQDTTRLRRPSDQRINISKGEVVTTRVDTVYVTRFDTVRVNNTIVRVDTVTVATPQPVAIARVRNNWFWGIAAGPTRPYGNVDRVYTNGFHGLGVLGFESQNSPWGFRLDGGVSQVGREETLRPFFTANQVGSGTPLMMHLAGDLKVAPLVFRGTKWYGIGGVNLNRYRGVALTSSNSKGPCDFSIRGECFENATTSWTTKFGFNFGAGVDFHIGSQDMFLEYRWLASRSNSSNTYMNPISLGLRYF